MRNYLVRFSVTKPNGAGGEFTCVVAVEAKSKAEVVRQIHTQLANEYTTEGQALCVFTATVLDPNELIYHTIQQARKP